MTLSNQDGKLFFKLFLSLLDYANERFEMEDPIYLPEEELLNQEAMVLTAQKLWSKPSVISDYLAWDRRIPQKQRAILQSWRRRIRGKFLVVEHRENGSLFVALDDYTVYLVQGIQSPLSELLPGKELPVGVTATLLPFKKAIITDGLIIKSEAPVEEALRKGMEKICDQAERDGTIITRI
jgi:hypothetical protein